MRCIGLEKGLDGTGCLEKVWWMARDGGESRRSETFPLALATTTIYYSALAFILLKLYLCYIFIVVALRLRCMYLHFSCHEQHHVARHLIRSSSLVSLRTITPTRDFCLCLVELPFAFHNRVTLVFGPAPSDIHPSEVPR